MDEEVRVPRQLDLTSQFLTLLRIRPSLIADKGSVVVAEQLTQTLKKIGDWQIAMPDLTK